MSHPPRVPSILQGIPDDLLSSDTPHNRRFKTDMREISDVLIFDGDALPPLTADDNGKVLEIVDIGDRYRWTGLGWLLTHLRGIPVPIDYMVEASSGNIPGITSITQEGRARGMPSGAFETLWDHVGNKKYFTVNTPLYVTSTDDTDTALLRWDGLDDEWGFIQTEVTLNGHTPVLVDEEFFRVREGKVINAAFLKGDVYLAEMGTWVDGVPQVLTDVQSKIPLEEFEVQGGEFGSTGITHNGFLSVPFGADVHLLSIIQSAAKGKDIRLDIRTRELGESWISIFNAYAYSGPGPLTLSNRGRIAERTDIEIRVLSGTTDGAFSAQLQLLLKV